MKKCSHCQEFKDETEFFKNRSTPSGLQNDCKVCHTISAKKSNLAYQAKHKQEIAEKRRIHYQNFKNVINERRRVNRRKNYIPKPKPIKPLITENVRKIGSGLSVADFSVEDLKFLENL
jgi:hypothetical protein